MYKVIGIKQVEFKGRDGELVKGVKLYCEFEDEGVDGIACDSYFLKPSIASGITVGDSIDIRYNRYGKVERVDLLD